MLCNPHRFANYTHLPSTIGVGCVITHVNYVYNTKMHVL